MEKRRVFSRDYKLAAVKKINPPPPRRGYRPPTLPQTMFGEGDSYLLRWRPARCVLF